METSTVEEACMQVSQAAFPGNKGRAQSPQFPEGSGGSPFEKEDTPRRGGARHPEAEPRDSILLNDPYVRNMMNGVDRPAADCRNIPHHNLIETPEGRTKGCSLVIVLRFKDKRGKQILIAVPPDTGGPYTMISYTLFKKLVTQGLASEAVLLKYPHRFTGISGAEPLLSVAHTTSMTEIWCPHVMGADGVLGQHVTFLFPALIVPNLSIPFLLGNSSLIDGAAVIDYRGSQPRMELIVSIYPYNSHLAFSDGMAAPPETEEGGQVFAEVVIPLEFRNTVGQTQET